MGRICPSFAECLDTGQQADNVPSSSFVRDSKRGNLPNFAIIIPGGKDAQFSEHNGLSMTAGDDWLGRIASTITNGPDWRSTVLFITWDGAASTTRYGPASTRTALRKGRAAR